MIVHVRPWPVRSMDLAIPMCAKFAKRNRFMILVTTLTARDYLSQTLLVAGWARLAHYTS